MDSACSDKSAIASRVLQLHTPSMRPCTRLQNANFSSTILESFAGSLTFLAFPKADSISTILESKSSENHKTRRSFFSKSTPSDSTLESTFSHNAPFLSLRADNGGAAIHKNKAQKVDSMDCHAIATALARNDRKPSLHTLESKRHKLHTSTHSLHIFLESTFSNDTLFLSSRDFRKEVVAIHNKKADSSVKMDCRAIATALARNDRKNSPCVKVDSSKNAAILNELAQDSRIFAHNVQSAFDTKAAGGRIFDEKVGLRRLLRGDKT